MNIISNDVFVRRKVGLQSACNGESCQLFMSVEINASTVVVVVIFIFIIFINFLLRYLISFPTAKVMLN